MNEQIHVKVINKSKHSLPEYETLMSAGMDLKANIDQDYVLQPLERRLIPTGLYIGLERGYEVQIRPRSGLALKKGITVLNSPGTIDADYRGELGIILINMSNEPFTVHDGDRVAQMVLAKHESVVWLEVDALDETDRGGKGFGHTGVVK